MKTLIKFTLINKNCQQNFSTMDYLLNRKFHHYKNDLLKIIFLIL
jgi:hypothetical protein